ncbi:MAG: formylglycine-generating enzyme family protein [Armatimonadota bacterium]|nr:formylglycine-generating enzyme family protein [Armatimonadota bacterium]
MALAVATGTHWLASVRAAEQAATQASPTTEKREAYEEKIPGTLVKFTMVPIPGGRYPMAYPTEEGTPGAVHEIEIKPFWMGKAEVTWDEFDIFVFRLDLSEAERAEGAEASKDATTRPSKPYGAPDRGFGHKGYAALAMTYHSAEMYCEWLSRKTGKKYRLPTEAEWEWAHFAGEWKSAPPDADALDKVAWYWDNAEDMTHAVASKQPNAWGLFDTLGNVWEWCTGVDGKPVVKGGGFLSKADKVHGRARMLQTPAWNETDPQDPKSKWWLANAPFVGFRVVRED